MKVLPSLLPTFATALLLLSGTIFAQEIGSPSQTAITTADCQSAWNQASASSSCTIDTLEAEQAPGSSIVNNCAVKAYCASTEGGSHDTFSDYHGGPDGVKTLKNCSGHLKPTC